ATFDLFFFSSRRRHTRSKRDWSSDVCSSDLANSTVGTVFTVEGTITAGNVEPNAFYDTIYIQDATGGINIYPVATTDGTFRVGRSEERRVGKECSSEGSS